MAPIVGSLKWNRILIDVCTQRDYLDADAVVQVANRDPVLARLREVFSAIRHSRMPVVSSMESHRHSEPPNGFPIHCIDGTDGQDKVAFTLLTPRLIVENDNYLSLPPDLKDYRQLVFRKRTRDLLSNPKADRFLTQSVVDEYVICGVGLERSIKSLGLGLLARHKRVSVILDACGFWSAADADLASRQLGAKGVRLLTTEEFISELLAPPALPNRNRLRSRSLRNRHHPGAVSRDAAPRAAAAKTRKP